MTFVVYLMLAYGIPIILGVGCAAVWWRVLPRPGFYLTVALLLLLGLQVLAGAAWAVTSLLLRSGGFYLERSSDLAAAALLAPGIFSAAVTALLGLYLLRNLKNALIAP